MVKVRDSNQNAWNNVSQLYGFDLHNRVILFNASGDRFGRVCYIGETILGGGPWVGVKLDKKTGDNDGRIKATRYFTCPPGYGIFVRPRDVKEKMEELQTKEVAIPLLDVSVDGHPVSRLINEIARAFECRICFDYNNIMIMCTGCGHFTMCQKCHNRCRNQSSCPGCIADWKDNKYLIRSDFFSTLVLIACDVRKEYNSQINGGGKMEANGKDDVKKLKEKGKVPLNTTTYQTVPSLKTLLHEIARMFRCGVCRSHKPSMVLCGGCGYLSVCYDCMKNVVEKKEEKNHCPVCLEQWSLPTSSSRVLTRAFQDLVQTAADVVVATQKKKKWGRNKGQAGQINGSNDDNTIFQIDPDTLHNPTMRPQSWLDSICYFFTGKL